jgi:hypothetical protein
VNATVRLLPAGITNTQSYTWVLRETFLANLAPLFPGYTILRTNQVPIQKWQLPILGIYLLPEKMTPDGVWNAGDIRFIHDFQIGFSIIVANNNPDTAEQKLDAAWWTLMNGLWPIAGLMNMLQSTAADNTRIEGVTLGVRRFVYGAIGINQETPVAELQYEATCRYRTNWPPVITDTLDHIHVDVVPAGVDQTKTEIVEVEYDFATEPPPQAFWTAFYLGF